jgi:hypothetical protein
MTRSGHSNQNRHRAAESNTLSLYLAFTVSLCTEAKQQICYTPCNRFRVLLQYWIETELLQAASWGPTPSL